MKLLMIEDNESVRGMMKMFFSNEKWDVTYAEDGQAGLNAFLAQKDAWDMVTLDLNLPKMDGIEVGRRIREISKTIPIIMLTARDSESDQVLGFEMGADDYVTKPFSPITLIARIKALHRRHEAHGEASTQNGVGETAHMQELKTKHLKITIPTREVEIDGVLIAPLTPKEFELLVFFVESPKRIFSREQLLQSVWDYSYCGDERTIDAHVKKLRQKLGKFGAQAIHTSWGVGYKFDDSEF
ncbi:MAG: response regulator transcription factor [Streptococcaceae bacterium]|nr:response regulator transcription factor [Streptococcaceae bacterium]